MKDVMSPDELLAAYAHRPEDLTAEEQARVEAMLADDPAKAGEADAIRALLVDARALPEPSPPTSLGRDIAAAIDRAQASPWARLRAWILRPAVGLVVCAGAAAAIGLWVAKRGDRAEVAVTAPTHAIDAQPAIVAPTAPRELFAGAPATAGELADLDGLDEHALDQLSANLDEELGEEGAAPAEDGLLADPDLGWVDELSSSDVDKLDHYLETQHRSPT